MMFEGPFVNKLKLLSEDYYYDMDWLKGQVRREGRAFFRFSI